MMNKLSRFEIWPLDEIEGGGYLIHRPARDPVVQGGEESGTMDEDIHGASSALQQ